MKKENCVISLGILALEIMRLTRFLCPGIISPPILRSASMIGHKGTNQAARYAPANQRFLGIKPNTIILQVWTFGRVWIYINVSSMCDRKSKCERIYGWYEGQKDLFLKNQDRCSRKRWCRVYFSLISVLFRHQHFLSGILCCGKMYTSQ